MSKLREVVYQFFEDDDWDIERDEDPALRVYVQTENGRFLCAGYVDEERGRFAFYALSPVTIPPERRADVAEFITRANFGLPSGNFELDFDSGDVGFKVSVDCPADELSPEMVERMVQINLWTMDRYFPALLAVAFGSIGAEEAVTLTEAGETDALTAEEE